MKTSEFRKQYKQYAKQQTKKKSQTPFEKHETHQVEIQLVSSYKHYAKIHCITCNKWVSWLSKEDTNNALKLGLLND